MPNHGGFLPKKSQWDCRKARYGPRIVIGFDHKWSVVVGGQTSSEYLGQKMSYEVPSLAAISPKLLSTDGSTGITLTGAQFGPESTSNVVTVMYRSVKYPNVGDVMTSNKMARNCSVAVFLNLSDESRSRLFTQAEFADLSALLERSSCAALSRTSSQTSGFRKPRVLQLCRTPRELELTRAREPR